MRKPNYSVEELRQFLSKVYPEFRSRLVLHQQHQVTNEFGISRIHFTESARAALDLESTNNNDVYIKSTSIHTMADFNQLESCFEYAFLSPIYQSISKPDYKSDLDAVKAITQRTNCKTKLVALGGISIENIEKTYQLRFDDVALLGSIWNSNQPIQNFKLCQKIAHL